MPEVLVSGLLEFEHWGPVLRVVLILTGIAGVLHYFLMCKAMEEADHWARVGAAVVAGAGMVAMVCGAMGYLATGAVFGTLSWAATTALQIAVWGQGIFVRDQLNRIHAMKKAAKQAREEAYNVYRNDLTVPWYSVSDLVTPSGFEEVKKSNQRAKERA